MSVVVGRIIELFDSTCSKQFESMSCDIHLLDIADFQHRKNLVCSLIECQSDDVQLALVISATRGFLDNTMPVIDEQQLSIAEGQSDWCLELANRFLGRLKNKLLSHGCSLNMGLPKLIECGSESKAMPSSDSKVTRVFQINSSDEESLICCYLRISLLSDKVALDDYEDEDEDWFDESELQHL